MVATLSRVRRWRLSALPPRARPAHVVEAWRSHGLRWFRSLWVDIAWAGFVGLNLAAMRFLPAWQTVPFLAIWVSLTAIYGFRLWRLQPTILTLAAVTLATGGIIGVQVLKGQQDADYLAEVPLIALMFLVMVWHGRRRLVAMEERLTAMEEVQRISQENLRLLEQQRRFLQDASHELGTPITVALGHVELIEQAVTDQVVAEDARVIAGELERLRRLAHRLLLLASAGSPDFLQVAPVAIDSVVLDALDRWGHTPRRWLLGEVAEATVLGDRDRLAVALDALLENAVAHTETGDRIEVSARLDDGRAVFAVADSGCGIPAAELERIFGRFARARPYRSREAGGFGLGLPIVQAITEAHDGSVRVHSTDGHGSTFEMLMPAVPAGVPMSTPQSSESSLDRSSDADAPRARR
jgi:signal transduction histidine kinase